MPVAPTVPVHAIILDQTGQPVPNAEFEVILDRPEPTTSEYIIPKRQSFTADANGEITMQLWPNELGTISSQYRIRVTDPATGVTLLSVMATIPNVACELSQVADYPPHQPKSAGQLAVDAAIAAVAPAQAAQQAAELARDAAQTAETNAAAHEAAAQTARTGAEAAEAGAQTAETNAAAHEAAAQTARSGAETAQAGAQTAETNAAAHEAAAQTARTGAEAAQAGAQTAETNAAADAAQVAADKLAVASDKTAVAADKTACDQAVIDAQQAETNAQNSASQAAQSEANAAAVVTGGTATYTPASGKIPLADANGHIHGDWLGELQAIAQTIAANAVDWCIYDTTKDSDGGAWRKRCQHLSWYNEPLNTATRGATREFPAKALVVAESNKVTIYDLTDPSVPMWMVFNENGWVNMVGEGPNSSLDMRDGLLAVGCHDVVAYLGYDLYLVNFLKDIGNQVTTSTNIPFIYNGDISQRNAALSFHGTPPYVIVSRKVNDVAITVLPDAPIDSATGLPVPTIAVATDGGVSVIKHDGTVCNIIQNFMPISGFCVFSGKYLFSLHGNGNPTVGYYGITDVGTLASSLTHVVSLGGIHGQSSGFPYLGGNGNEDIAIVTSTLFAAPLGGSGAGANSQHLMLDRVNLSNLTNSMVAYLTSIYNTGWMVGDVLRCFLANSLTADRSVKAGTLTVVGTITETVNAGGRNVYSGFGATNYLQEPSHADWNALGTSDFWIAMSGFKWGTNVTRQVMEIGDGASAGSVKIRILNAKIEFLYHNGTSYSVILQNTSARTDTNEHVVQIFRRSGIVYLVIDDTFITSAAFTSSISNANGGLTIGANFAATGAWTGGQVACVRISATAPTDEQALFVARSENALNGGAPCLLSADAVTRLTYDEDSDILGVETAAGYDYLTGLEVIHRGVALTDNTDLGFQRVQANGTTDLRVSVPARTWRDALLDRSRKLAEAQQAPQTFGFSGDGTTVTFWLQQGWRPQSVYVGGVRKLEGSTADYTVAFDGFLYGVTFAVAPAAGTNNVVVEGVRA